MPQTGKPSSKFRALIELLRPANVVTATADVLAGYAASGAPQLHSGQLQLLPWLLAATVCLYGGGIVLNDFFDRHLDALERPERPIPSGRIGAAVAGTVGFVLLAAGIGFARFAGIAAAAVAAVTSASILLYDVWGKHRKFFGPVNMGACRAFNLLLGVAVVPAALGGGLALGLLPLIYIAAVTAISRGEVNGGKRGVAAFSIGAIGVVLASLVWIDFQEYSGPSGTNGLRAILNPLAALAVVAILAWRVLPPFWRAYREPVPTVIRSAVRAGVLSLVLLDAAIAASYFNVLYCLIILGIAVLASLLARVFSVT